MPYLNYSLQSPKIARHEEILLDQSVLEDVTGLRLSAGIHPPPSTVQIRHAVIGCDLLLGPAWISGPNCDWGPCQSVLIRVRSCNYLWKFGTVTSFPFSPPRKLVAHRERGQGKR